MKNKILIVGLSLMIIGSILFSIFVFANKKDNQDLGKFKINNLDVTDNEELLKDTMFGELSITDQLLYTENGVSTYSAIVINNSDISFYVDNLYVSFMAEDEEIESLVLYNSTFQPGKKLDIHVSFDIDLSRVTKIRFITRENQEVDS